MFINDTFSTGGPARGDKKLWRETVIGNRVSIGSNATILPVKIADDVVIGAGAVVTRDITKAGTYAGNPARRLRNRKDKMPVPFADLQLQYQTIKREIDGAIAAVIGSNRLHPRAACRCRSSGSLPSRRRSSIACPAPTAPTRSISRWRR